PSVKEQPVYAVLADREPAGDYIQIAPKIRLSQLKWLGIDNDILMLGTPVLPITGRSFWKHNDFLLPAGFEFEFPLLSNKLKLQLDHENKNVILWLQNNTYILLEKETFMPLSISSFRLTYTTE